MALIGFQGAEFSTPPIRRVVALNPLPYLGSCKSRSRRKRAISPNSLKPDKSHGNKPVVKLTDKIYETGVRLTQKAMAELEKRFQRLPGLEKWFVSIDPILA